MKNKVYFLCLLIVIGTIAISCKKNDILENPVQERSVSYQSRSVFPTYIEMGNDTTFGRTDSVTFYGYSSYLSSCGTAPETEAPLMGVKVYPILYPSFVTIGWTTYNGKAVPYAKGTKPGVYKFVGSAYIIGFRTCDSTYQNVEVYDTVTITVLKSRKTRN